MAESLKGLTLSVHPGMFLCLVPSFLFVPPLVGRASLAVTSRISNMLPAYSSILSIWVRSLQCTLTQFSAHWGISRFLSFYFRTFTKLSFSSDLAFFQHGLFGQEVSFCFLTGMRSQFTTQ